MINDSMFEQVIEVVAEKVRERIALGKFNRFMSTEGLAALMTDKLQRWFETRDESELDELAVDAFLLLFKNFEDTESDALGPRKIEEDS